MGNLIIKGKGGAGNKLILQDQAGAAVLTTADSGATLANATVTDMSNFTFPAGHVLQVVSSNKTDTDSISSGTWSDIDGTDNNGSGSVWCCKITPKSTSSKIVIGGTVNIGQGAGNNSAVVRFLRDSTLIGIGDQVGSRDRAFTHLFMNQSHNMAAITANFLDSPNTASQVTYKAQFRSEGGSYTTHINRNNTYTDALVNGTIAFSNILLMEIAG